MAPALLSHRTSHHPSSARPAAVSHQLIVDLARNAVMLALLIAGPMLIVALGVGLIVSVIQAVTQIQEQTLSFVPKLVAVGATFLIALPWILQLLIKYTTELYRSLPTFVS
jgi:flagellar biosynthesis protein FliQ